MNGAGAIHDYELARIGATTESVARYIRTGEFGLWRETGELNDWIARSRRASAGPGRERRPPHRRRAIIPHRDLSVLAAAWRRSVPVTVHVGIGYDIMHEHPNCDGAALGAASYRDFLIFARTVERLEGGVLLSFGSAIMAPEVYLKALAMARNVAHQEGREIRHFATAVFDLVPIARRHSPGTAQDRSRLLFPAAQDHPGAHRGRWRRELLFLRRSSRHLPGAAARHSGTGMTTAEILAAIPEAVRAGGGRHLPGPLVHLRSRRQPSLRAKPASRASAWCRTEVTPGAGGTVANNLAALGVRPRGRAGRHRRRWLRLGAFRAPSAARGISSDLLRARPDMQTFTYTKLINRDTGIEDQPRIDFINTDAAHRPRWNGRFSTACEMRRGCLRCDPGFRPGRDQPGRRGHARRARPARRAGARIPGEDLLGRFPRAHRALPQRDRQTQPAGGRSRLPRAVRPRRLSRALRRHLEAPLLVVTHGGERRAGGGRTAAKPGSARGRWSTRWISAAPATASPPARRWPWQWDATPAEAARFGNLVASITIMKKGTGTASPEEVCCAELQCTLAIDIGGTKFSMAVFRRRPHGAPRVPSPPIRRAAATGCWRRSLESCAEWRQEFRLRALRHRLRRSGEFRRAARGAFHARGRLARFPPYRASARPAGRSGHHGQRRQRRRARRGRSTAPAAAADPLFYMTLSTGIGGGIYYRRQRSGAAPIPTAARSAT